jgi:hypothetical protein
MYLHAEKRADDDDRPRDSFTACLETLTSPPSAIDEATNKIAWKVGEDDARELAIDLALSICAKADDQRDIRAVYFVSLRNDVVDLLRKRAVEANYRAIAAVPIDGKGPTLQSLVLACPAPSADPLEVALSMETQTIVAAWIRVNELTFEEIAERTDRKRSTVYDRWNKLSAQLRGHFRICEKLGDPDHRRIPEKFGD